MKRKNPGNFEIFPQALPVHFSCRILSFNIYNSMTTHHLLQLLPSTSSPQLSHTHSPLSVAWENKHWDKRRSLLGSWKVGFRKQWNIRRHPPRVRNSGLKQLRMVGEGGWADGKDTVGSRCPSSQPDFCAEDRVRPHSLTDRGQLMQVSVRQRRNRWTR